MQYFESRQKITSKCLSEYNFLKVCCVSLLLSVHWWVYCSPWTPPPAEPFWPRGSPCQLCLPSSGPPEPWSDRTRKYYACQCWFDKSTFRLVYNFLCDKKKKSHNDMVVNVEVVINVVSNHHCKTCDSSDLYDNTQWQDRQGITTFMNILRYIQFSVAWTL